MMIFRIDSIEDHAKLFNSLPSNNEYVFKRSPEEAKGYVICLHGYTATPYETKSAGQKFYDEGFSAECPSFHGHSIRERDEAISALSMVTWQEWIEQIKTRIELARKEKYRKVFLFGHSMGGAIALYLSGLGLCDGVAVTGPALYLPYFIPTFVTLFGWISFLNFPSLFKRRPQQITYSFHNINALKQLYLLSEEAKKKVKEIEVPVFVGHSHDDEKVIPQAAEFVKNVVGQKCVLKWYEGSAHAYLLDVHAPQILTDLVEFFDSLVFECE